MHSRRADPAGTCAWLVAVVLVGLARGGTAADAPPIQVHLADGSSLPLLEWTFSYEYTAFKQGEPHGPPLRRESRELWTGKRTLPTTGLTLGVDVGNTLSVVEPGGKVSRLRAEAPHAELLLPEGRKGRLVIPRSLDLRGTTLGGTSRQFCLVSYSTLVSCGGEEADRVVRIEFPSAAAP